jgi:hypothetical protein
MPLTLSLDQGDDFFVDDRQFVLEEVLEGTHFRIRRFDDRVFDIVEDRATEVWPDVWVSSGERPQSLMARISIDAPRSIRIKRGDIYREGPRDRERK